MRSGNRGQIPTADITYIQTIAGQSLPAAERVYILIGAAICQRESAGITRFGPFRGDFNPYPVLPGGLARTGRGSLKLKRAFSIGGLCFRLLSSTTVRLFWASVTRHPVSA